MNTHTPKHPPLPPKKPRVLIFRGPMHHGQLLRPVEDELRMRGWETIYYTADVEACFQIPLHQEVPQWEWLPDWVNEAEARALYQTHVPRFRELLAQPNGLSLVAPQVLDRIIYTMCREWVGLKALFAAKEPQAILLLHEINRWGGMIAHLANRQGIPVWTLQEGLYYSVPAIYRGHTRNSTSLVWGEGTKEVLVQAGCDPQKIRVMGHPDIGKRYETALTQETLWYHELPIDLRDRHLVLLYLPSIEYTEGTRELVRGWDAQQEWGLVVKYHHLTSHPNLENIKQWFTGIPGVWIMEGEETWPGPLWRALAFCEQMIVLGCSTIFAEWLAHPKGLRAVGNYAGPGMPRDYSEDPAISLKCTTTLLDSLQRLTQWPQQCGAQAAQWIKHEIAHPHAAAQMAALIAGESID